MIPGKLNDIQQPNELPRGGIDYLGEGLKPVDV